MLKYNFPKGLQSILVDWDSELLTDGEAIDLVLTLIKETHPNLHNHIVNISTIEGPDYLTDYQSIIYVMEYFKE